MNNLGFNITLDNKEINFIDLINYISKNKNASLSLSIKYDRLFKNNYKNVR